MEVRFVPLWKLTDFDFPLACCDWPDSVWDASTESCLPLTCEPHTCHLAYNRQQPPSTHRAEEYLTLIVLLISIFFLLLHNIIYCLEPKRRNVPSQILACLSWSIIFGHVSFLFLDIKDRVPLYVCKSIGLSTQFFYLSSFFWMNVMSYDVWRTFSKVTVRGNSSRLFRKYNMFSWGSSSVIVSVTLIADGTSWLPDSFRPHIGLHRICWFVSKSVIGIYFFLPVFILLSVNLYLFVKTVIWFQKQTSKEFDKVNNEVTGRKEYLKLWLYIKLFVIMGLTWLFSVVSSTTDIELFRYIFIVLNGLQGAAVFFLFDLKKRIFYRLYDNVKGKASWSSSSSEGKHTRTKETTTTHISRHSTLLSIKFNTGKK